MQEMIFLFCSFIYEGNTPIMKALVNNSPEAMDYLYSLCPDIDTFNYKRDSISYNYSHKPIFSSNVKKVT